MPNDDLVRDRPPRENLTRGEVTEQEILDPTSAWLQACLNQLDTDPARAHTMAQLRRSETTGAERVLVTHGYVAPVVRWLREHGTDAYGLDTHFGDEAEE